MKKSLLFFLFSIFVGAVDAQQLMESSVSYLRFTTADGLPQMQTETVFQDADGFIYIGTLSGFVRYDGQGLTPFLKGRRENIVAFAEVDGKVRALGFRRQWVVDTGDASPLPIDRHNVWLLNNFNSPCLPNGLVMLEDKNEENRRVCRIEKGGMRTLLYGTLFDRMTPDRKMAEYDGALYMPCEDGLFRIPTSGKGAGKAVCISRKKDFYTLHEMNDSLYALAADGVYVVGRGKVADFAFESADYGLSVCHNERGEMFIADDHCIYRFARGRMTKMASGFNMIKSVFVDRWNRLWAATYQGAYCFFECNFTNYRLTDADDIVRAIGVDDSDCLFFGTLNGKLIGTTNNFFTSQFSIFNFQFSPSDFYLPVTARWRGQVYMIDNKGVVCVSRESTRRLPLPKDKWRFVVAGSGGNRLIIGSRKQIVTYSGETVDTLTTQVYQPWTAAEDRKGNVYIGSTRGLYKIEAGTDTRRPKKLIGKHDNSVITVMTTDGNGGILFATADSLFCIKNDSITNIYNEELRGHEIRAMHVTKDGYLVVATIDGLLVADMKGYGGNGGTDRLRFFDHRNGFTMIEPLMATIGETADGRVWIAGLEEMTAFYPADLLSHRMSDTVVRMPARWYGRWWIWLVAAIALALIVWAGARSYEKQRNRNALRRLAREMNEREAQIKAIRSAVDDYMVNNINEEELAMTIAKIEAPSQRDGGMGEKIAFRTASGRVFVDEKDVAYILADGNYAQVVMFETSELVLESLANIERRLNSRWFLRVDRKTMINHSAIYKVNPKRCTCVLRSSTGIVKEIELSKKGMETIMKTPTPSRRYANE